MPDVRVADSTMHYTDSGSGTTYVFLHGNPASSHVWRNVLPHVQGRVLAPDLIGMGRSGKPDIPYGFADHARYLDAWFDVLELDDVVLVGHDWGGALAFDWAARHPERVRGVAFLESIVKPLDWDELAPPARARVESFRSAKGEELILEQDSFIRQAFTGGVLTPLVDIAPYLAPFQTSRSRRPILAWARQMPVGGEPAGLIDRIRAFDYWLERSPSIPKLLMTFTGSPTLLITPEIADWCADHIAALEIVPCGAAGHHAPEDRPLEIAAALAAWAARHEL